MQSAIEKPLCQGEKHFMVKVPSSHQHTDAVDSHEADTHAHCTHSHNDHEHNHDHHHGEHHDHDHDHSHGWFSAHSHAPASFGMAFAIGILVNTIYTGAEVVWGLLSHSLALLSDAGHNLSDILALGAAWLADTLSKRSPDTQFTYGLRRSSVLAALSNAVVLLLVTGGVAWEAILRLSDPTPVAGKTVMIVAALGILINGGSALLFAAGQKHDLNIRAAFLHLMSDAVISLAVVVAGWFMLLTGKAWIDPVVSIIISALIALTTWNLLRDAMHMAMDAVPASVDYTAVKEFLLSSPGVEDLHDLHIWPLSTTETALTVHLVRSSVTSDKPAETSDNMLTGIHETLLSRFRIAHATIQIESAGYVPSCRLTDPDSV
ncbi:cation diffusion facilitator family transporter [Acetobacter thailandicus]|nr:cation diffusion facilitator family transporter [Acetobacter thailandicus]